MTTLTPQQIDDEASEAVDANSYRRAWADADQQWKEGQRNRSERAQALDEFLRGERQ